MSYTPFKMKGPSLYSSPVKDKGSVDTTFADQVYNKKKVNENLTKSGHHTETNIRGKKNTDQGSVNIGGGNRQQGPSDMDI